MSTLAHSEPVPPSGRADLLDALRGFALFGVLASNMVGFSGAINDHVDPSTAATLTQFGLDWLMHGKFYSIFSLLFGIGFALQFGRLEARGKGVGRYMRASRSCSASESSTSSCCGRATSSHSMR